MSGFKDAWIQKLFWDMLRSTGDHPKLRTSTVLMKKMSVERKLTLVNAPVVETAIQVQFSDVPHWTSVKLGLFQSSVETEYGEFKDVPEMPPILETFPPCPSKLQFQIAPAAGPGCGQFESEAGDRLIRVQRNRFSYHWLSRPVSEKTQYTSFDLNFEKFRGAFAKFGEYCLENGLGELSPVLCEVMYLNHIHLEPSESIESALKSVFGLDIGSFEMASLNRTYALDERGRLYAEINVNFDNDRPFLSFQLTSRLNHLRGDVFETLNEAHDWLIAQFCSLTTASARKERWKQVD